MTLRGRTRFEAQDWRGAQQDSVERLELYRGAVRQALDGLAAQLGAGGAEPARWRSLKAAYADHLAGRADAELAETFFNSVVRRMFGTVGVDPDTEFVSLAEPAPESADDEAIAAQLPGRDGLARLVGDALDWPGFGVPFENRTADVALATRAVERDLPGCRVEGLQLARPVFFRNKAAYLIGRLRHSGGSTPVVFALLNPGGRLVLDAVLLGEDAVSLVFSFTRSYFFVDVERPRQLVAFLRGLMPRKPVAELYNAIGQNRHGKTELYRALRRHVDGSEELFDVAPGARGMVMLVFTLPSYDLVFKVIKDRFDYPKTTTRREVIDKYRLVFQHDRAGRLIEAQQFEHLEFERRRFTDDLLRRLAEEASGAVDVRDRAVILRHVYTERRLKPLDLYLKEAAPAAARAAILDYGEALRDLAATNIFPGDLLLKNFGVTRLGRVVFYDYDEVCLLTDLNFRELPSPRSDDEETAGEPWFYVGERDVFPEEILPFLGLSEELRGTFLEAHGDLLQVPFWARMQEEHSAGRVLDLFPYAAEQRLRRAG